VSARVSVGDGVSARADMAIETESASIGNFRCAILDVFPCFDDDVCACAATDISTIGGCVGAGGDRRARATRNGCACENDFVCATDCACEICVGASRVCDRAKGAAREEAECQAAALRQAWRCSAGQRQQRSDRKER